MIRQRSFMLVLLLMVTSLVACGPGGPGGPGDGGATLTGTWRGTVAVTGNGLGSAIGSCTLILQLSQTGTSLSGTVTGCGFALSSLNGSASGGTISFTCDPTGGSCPLLPMSGSYSSTSISLSGSYSCFGTTGYSGTFTRL